jgi:hypothetical protein
MRALLAAFIVLCIGLLLASGTNFAQEKAAPKEVKLKGTITCAKCDLKLEKKCWTVIVVKDKDKDVVYYFNPESTKKYHEDVCAEAKKGSIEGSYVVEDKKNILTVKKLTYE